MRTHIRARWLAAVVVAGLTAPLAATAGPAPAQAADGEFAGYVLAHDPVAAQYVVDTGYEYNSAGGAVSVNRLGTGRYQVRFEGLTAATRGVAHASAVGNTTGFCKVDQYGPRADDFLVGVRCFDHNGLAADSRFVANYTNRRSTTGTFAWLWSHLAVPPPAGYTPSTWFDSTGQEPVVTRTGLGHYLVDLGALTDSFPNSYVHGVLRATATGAAPVRCEVLDPRLEDPWAVPVRCYRADGSFADSPFTVTLAHEVDLLGADGPLYGMALAHPSPVLDPAVTGWTNPGGAPTAIRLNVGRYLLTFPQLGVPRGHAIAHSLGSPPAYCNTVGWTMAGGDNLVEVNCRHPNGVPTDVWAFQVTITR